VTTHSPDYATYTLSELNDVVEIIDRVAHSENALALDREMVRRLATASHRERPSDSSSPLAHSGGLRPWRVVLAAIAATFLVGLSGIYLLVLFQTQSARRYVETEVKPFIQTWNPDIFVALTPDPNNERLRTNVPVMVATFAKVGTPTRLGRPEGYVSLSFNAGIIPSCSAMFVVEGDFPTGSAMVEIALQKSAGKWYLNEVTVKSDYFLTNPI